MYSVEIFFTGNMNNKKQKLELTWIGKDEQPRLEPRILIEDPERSYGDKNSGKPWKYVLIPHNAVQTNMSFETLTRKYEIRK